MSGTTSSFRAKLPPGSPESGGGSTASTASFKGEGPPSSADDEPTVISTRAPMEMAATTAPPTAPKLERLGPGTRIANYELLECVGGGGMGLVFRARDTTLARIVALKVLTPEQTADGEVLLRFRNEAQTAARLNHEGVVQVYHAGEDGGVAYIAFEFIEGMNVRTLVEKRGVLPPHEAIHYTYQVAEALAHAAAHHVVHRDIKPSNILITAEGQAKLIDLGLARLYKSGEDADDLTASGVTLGTFDYISPEQARDPRTADVRSDIYSLGCTLFFMLTGRPPFVEGTVLQKLLQHHSEEPPDVRQFRPELPPEVSRLLRKMMAKDPRRRFQDPSQLLDALARLADIVGVASSAPGSRRWTSGGAAEVFSWHRHLPWIIPTLVLALAALALHFLWSPPPIPLEPMPDLAADLEQSAAPPPLRLDPSSAPFEKAGGATAGDAAEVPGVDLPESGPQTKSSVPAEGASSRNEPMSRGKAGPKDPREVSPSVSAANSGSNASGVAKPEASASATAPPSPSVFAPLASKAANGVGVKIVDPAATGPDIYPTLAAACESASTGDVVALRYNGPQREGPLVLRNLKLTIRAADGFQPVIVFRPADWEPLQRTNSMLSVLGSQLTMIRVGLVLEVPREAAADRWSLIESRSAEMIRLEKCWLSIQNASAQLGPYHLDAAFFRVLAGPGGGVLPRDPPAAPQRLTLELVDCVLRGEATALVVHEQTPVRFSWDNGLLATTDRLFVALGGDRTASPGEGMQLSLGHVTALVRGGLCRFAPSAAGAKLLPVQIDCRNSIVIGDPSAALIEHVEVGDIDGVRQGFAWNGERNFYEGFVSFWTIRAPGKPAETMSLDAWREFWGPQRENAPHSGRVQWKRFPPSERPVSSHLPADYALSPSDATNNPAIGAANDGRDVGCLFDRLPEVDAARAATVESRQAESKGITSGTPSASATP